MQARRAPSLGMTRPHQTSRRLHPRLQVHCPSSPPSYCPPRFLTHVVTPDRLDFGVWSSADGRTLLIGTNLNNATVSISVSEVVSAANLSVAALGVPRMVLNGGSSIVRQAFTATRERPQRSIPPCLIASPFVSFNFP